MHPDQDPNSLTAEEIVQKRRWIIGTPDEAIEQIQQLYEFQTESFAESLMSIRGRFEKTIQTYRRGCAKSLRDSMPSLLMIDRKMQTQSPSY